MELETFLREHGIDAPRHEHASVMTVEESLRLVPKLPGAAFTAVPLLWLSGVAAVLMVAGLAAFRRRDVG